MVLDGAHDMCALFKSPTPGKNLNKLHCWLHTWWWGVRTILPRHQLFIHGFSSCVRGCETRQYFERNKTANSCKLLLFWTRYVARVRVCFSCVCLFVLFSQTSATRQSSNERCAQRVILWVVGGPFNIRSFRCERTRAFVAPADCARTSARTALASREPLTIEQTKKHKKSAREFWPYFHIRTSIPSDCCAPRISWTIYSVDPLLCEIVRASGYERRITGCCVFVFACVRKIHTGILSVFGVCVRVCAKHMS